MKCGIRFSTSFRWYAFPNFCTQISRQLVCGVRISSKASATGGTYRPFVSRSRRKGAKAAALLCPLLGVTWVVAFLNFSGTLLITEYLFAILNSMQVKRAGEAGLIYGTGWRNSAQGAGLLRVRAGETGTGEVGGFRCWLNLAFGRSLGENGDRWSQVRDDILTKVGHEHTPFTHFTYWSCLPLQGCLIFFLHTLRNSEVSWRWMSLWLSFRSLWGAIFCCLSKPSILRLKTAFSSSSRI